MDTPAPVSRRTLLQRGAVLGAAAAAGGLPGCSSSAPARPAARPGEDATTTPRAAGRMLLAYFSRAGENYYRGGRRTLAVGNTEVLARMIADLVEVDLHRIEPADPYPEGYDATVARNVEEQDAAARPAIANPLDSVSRYATVLVGSPVWNVRPPMIMTTFLESHDLRGRTVHPFVTYAVSGLGRTGAVYAAAAPGARLEPGLAVRGEEVAERRADVEAWLRSSGLTS